MRDALNGVDFPVIGAQLCTALSVLTVQDIDTAGFRSASIRVLKSRNASDTGAAASTLRLLHSDATGASAAGTLTSSIGTLMPAITLARHTATNGVEVRIEVDLKGCKRYLRLEYTAGTGTTGDIIAAIATMSRAETGPANATALTGTAFSTGGTVYLLAGGASTNTSLA